MVDYNPYITPSKINMGGISFYWPRIRHHKVLGVEWYTAHVVADNKRIFRCARTEKSLMAKWNRAIGEIDEETTALLEAVLKRDSPIDYSADVGKD